MPASSTQASLKLVAHKPIKHGGTVLIHLMNQ
jgi:hypothetical protein